MAADINVEVALVVDLVNDIAHTSRAWRRISWTSHRTDDHAIADKQFLVECSFTSLAIITMEVRSDHTEPLQLERQRAVALANQVLECFDGLRTQPSQVLLSRRLSGLDFCRIICIRGLHLIFQILLALFGRLGPFDAEGPASTVAGANSIVAVR